MDPQLPTPGRATHWWHLLMLLGVVTILETGSMLVGLQDGASASLLFQALYGWIPALVGIAIAIGCADRGMPRRGVALGVTGIGLMIVLDLVGGLFDPELRDSAALRDSTLGEFGMAGSAAPSSWIRLVLGWMEGGLPEGVSTMGPYVLGHPRLQVAEAVSEAGLILLVFASIGFVIAIMSWIRAHVVFRRAADQRAAQVVVAWIATPLLTALAGDLTGDQRFQVLFRGAPLWRPLLPYVLLLLAALAVWRATSGYRESGEP
jgi:hypothetical protein